MEKEKTFTKFDDFTNLYEVQKTLRFKLLPIWNTQQMLDLNNEGYSVIERDRVRHEKYEDVKPWFDQLHREFIKDALKDFEFNNLKTYKSAFQAWQKNRKSKQAKDALIKTESSLREEIVNRFEKTANAWATSERYKSLGLKKEGIGMLFEAGVFKLLKERFKGGKDTVIDGNNIFDDWNKWTGYFKKFFETRKNFYKSDDTSTAIAYRIVNQNLRRFCENLQTFGAIRKKGISVVEVEKSFKVSCADIFSLGYYNACFLQDGIDAYNKIIGGEMRENNDEKIQGINELVNKYRQDNHGGKVPFLKMLDRQILSEKEAFIESIETDAELLGKLKDFYKNADAKMRTFRQLITSVALDYSTYDLNKIYLSKEALERNANRWFANYESFERDLFAIVAIKQNKQEYELLRTHKNDSKISDKDGKFFFPGFIKCAHIQQALQKQEGLVWKEKYYENMPSLKNIEDKFTQFLHIFQYELEGQFFHKITDDTTGKLINVGYDVYVKPIIEFIKQGKSSIHQQTKVDIKNFADAARFIYQMAKYFAVEKRRAWLDNYDLDDHFYKSSDIGYFNFYRDAFEQIVRPYNLFRNYLTKKPYSTDKWVLNFENPTLADGWDKNKEVNNAAVLFEKDKRFYLGIMKKGHTGLFTDDHRKDMSDFKGETYRKMVYKYFPNPSQMIPKCSTQLKDARKHFEKSGKTYCLFDRENFVKPLEITKRVFDLNNFEYQKSYLQTVNGGVIDESRKVKADSQKQNQIKIFQKEFWELSENMAVYKQALTDWINFCKFFLSAYRSTATSNFDYLYIRNASEYESIDQFYRDVEKGSYKLSWSSESEAYLRKKNEAGELFIFEIRNKDWNLGPKNKKRKRTKNLHTLYWENLFSDDNFKKNFPFKLNGGAELFFRPKTDESKLGYKIWDAKEKVWKRIDKKSNGAVVDRKRYAQDTISFHCPITLNRVSENKTKYEVDASVRQVIYNNPNVHIIGVDRGEKHLIYYSVIDQRGIICEKDSLNAIGEDSEGKPIAYAIKLETMAKEREASRRDWKEVEAIKDLKQGYISQVIRKLADLIIERNAIIIFEDLSMRFKQVRGGIEKSVYQQLEKALIDKLSFLVNKGEKDPKQAGHILRAYQLAAPMTAFKDIGKQTGVIFYTQAGYTSKTCPKCGYRRNIKCRFENIEQAKKLIKNLESISYNGKKDAFIIRYSLERLFNKEHKKENKLSNELYIKVSKKDIFTLTTKDALRYKWYDRYSEKAKVAKHGIDEYRGAMKESETKKGIVKVFNLTEYIKGLLEVAKVDYKHGDDIKEQIVSNARGKEFYQDFLYALFLLTETRHSISGTDTDYIQCPQCGFDSRLGFQGVKEFNGDANGAYNIARKGIMILEKIKQYKEKNGSLDKMGWGDLAISIEEWDKFTQKDWQEK